MNNFNENADQQQEGENAQSLLPVHVHSRERQSSTPQRVVNKSKYLNKQLATQELAKHKPQKDIVLDGYKCLVCESSTIMHMHMIACMKNYMSSNYNVIRPSTIPSTQRQICGANYNMSRPTAISSQRQICGANTASEMAMVPSMGIVPCTENKINLCCAHCNLDFDNEQQVLEHGHIVQFKRKYKIK